MAAIIASPKSPKPNRPAVTRGVEIAIHLPKSLHAALLNQARIEGVTLNQLVVRILRAHMDRQSTTIPTRSRRSQSSKF